MLTHRNFASNTQAALERIWLTDADVHLSFLPLSHAFERVAGYFVMLAAGARIAYAESVDAVAKNLPEVRPTVMVSVPRLFERVYTAVQKSVDEGGAAKQKIFGWAVRSGRKAAQAKAQGDRVGPLLGAQARLGHRLVFSGLHEKLGGRVRLAVSGGAALPKEIGAFFQAAGVPIIEGYGLTETAPVLSVAPERDPHYGTVGHVLPGVTVAIQDLTTGRHVAQVEGGDYGHGAETLTSAPGEILAKGPNVMKGYWNDERATREVIDPDGWFHTGDVGRFVDGHLQITDRLKHMIVSKGGKNIYPAPIEERFKTEPLIDQLLVVGEGRAFLTALVVPNEDAVRALAKANGLSGSLAALLGEAAVQKPFAAAFRAYSKAAASHEKIRDFRLLPEPFSVENDLLTPTMKPKRRKIEAAYADQIDGMYASAA